MSVYSLVDEKDFTAMPDIDRVIREKNAWHLLRWQIQHAGNWKRQVSSQNVLRLVNVPLAIVSRRFRRGSVAIGTRDGNRKTKQQ